MRKLQTTRASSSFFFCSFYSFSLFPVLRIRKNPAQKANAFCGVVQGDGRVIMDVISMIGPLRIIKFDGNSGFFQLASKENSFIMQAVKLRGLHIGGWKRRMDGPEEWGSFFSKGR